MDPNQNDHRAFREALDSARGPLIISPFVVAELDYMILRDYGREDQVAFLDEVDRGAYRLEPFDSEDFARARSYWTNTPTCRASESPTPPTWSWRNATGQGTS